MQVVPVVTIGITVVAVSRPVSAEAMRGVLVQSKPMRANGADVSVAKAAHVFAANATDVASAAKASNVTSTAKTAAHMAAAAEAAAAKTSAVAAATTTTAATAGVGRARQQA